MIKDIYNHRLTKVIDVLLVLGLLLLVIPWYYYYYTDKEVYLSNPNSKYFGPPINCSEVYLIECIPIHGEMLYPEEPYIKEVSPITYWAIQNQGKLAIAIILYLAVTRFGMFKKKDE